MPGRRLKESVPSRERVLASATEEYARYGFAGARIDRIARRGRLNVRMIYYHFGSKEGLYRAVLREIYARSAAMLAQASAVPHPDLRGVEAISLYVDFLTARPDFADVLVRELLDGGAHVRAIFEEQPELYQAIHRPAFRLVQNAIDAGEFRDVPAAETVLAVTSAVLFLLASRDAHDLFLGRKPGTDEWKRLVIDLVMNGLRRRG
jgi:AcrR family transcriptional regulator